jgi:hypothetical protein
MANVIDIWTGGAAGKTYADRVRPSFPLLHIRATPETLTVRVAWKRHTLRQDQVSAVRRFNEPRPFFGTYLGIGIMHTHPKCPQFVLFSTWGNREVMLERFRQLGYNAAEGIGSPKKRPERHRGERPCSLPCSAASSGGWPP